jgi:hypothetical protein
MFRKYRKNAENTSNYLDLYNQNPTRIVFDYNKPSSDIASEAMRDAWLEVAKAFTKVFNTEIGKFHDRQK